MTDNKTPVADEHHKVVDGKNGKYLVKKVKSDLDKRLNESEEALLLASFTKENHGGHAERNRAIITFLLNTGLRVAEFSHLKVYDVLKSDGDVKETLEVRPETAKRNKGRQVPLNTNAKEAIRILIGNASPGLTDSLIRKNDESPLSRRSIQDIVKNAGLRAGVTRLIGPHALRHTFLSKVYMKTKNVKVTQQLAGHSDPKMTMQLYTHTTMDEMASAVEEL